jgi:hypothetical protein
MERIVAGAADERVVALAAVEPVLVVAAVGVSLPALPQRMSSEPLP